MTQASIVEIQDSLMRRNDELAAALRARFAADGTRVVNLLSSPQDSATTTNLLTGQTQAFAADWISRNSAASSGT